MELSLATIDASPAGDALAVYRIQLYLVLIPTAVAAGGVILTVLAVRKRLHPLVQLIPITVVALFGVVMAPAMYADRVVVYRDRIEQTTGLAFAPTKKGFRYRDVACVRIKEQFDDPDRDLIVWEITDKSGNSYDLDPGDLWDFNKIEIVALLRAQGVFVEDTTS
jgi:hypothetical protein